MYRQIYLQTDRQIEKDRDDKLHGQIDRYIDNCQMIMYIQIQIIVREITELN